MFQAYNEPLAAPNLDVVAVNQVQRLGYGLAVVATNQRLKAYEVTVERINELIQELQQRKEAMHKSSFHLIWVATRIRHAESSSRSARVQMS